MADRYRTDVRSGSAYRTTVTGDPAYGAALEERDTRAARLMFTVVTEHSRYD
jgi:hypothetical protein